MDNAFSPTWFSIFLDTMASATTEAEVAFVVRHLPPDRFPRLLDLCCGSGRHALPLHAHGYDVLGVDKNHSSRRLACSPEASCSPGT